jgi:class 3 adenylate cyclase/YHS domain-containing protein
MPESSLATFLFADIAGFTALTEVHGDENAADLAGEFGECVAVLLPQYGGEQIKAIGDALMIRVPEAGDAVRLGLAITHDAMRDHLSPSVRVGMHTGPAVERDGDWFGSAVNTAARISALASGGEVLVSEATRELAGDESDFAFRSHGRHRLHNLKEPVVVFAAVRLGEADDAGLPIDPVCRMAIDPKRASSVILYEGTEYHFCSLPCVEAFARAPDEYTAQR